MDENPLDDFSTLLQNKTMIVDSYSGELQSYVSLLRSMKVELSAEQFDEVENLLVVTTDACDELDVQMQTIVKCMQRFLPHQKGPKV